MEEQADPKSPKYKDSDHRGKPPIPCQEHGDPRFLYPENRQAIEIYNIISPYHIVKEYEHQEQRLKRVYIDMALTLELCKAYQVEDVHELLDKIDVIHKEIYHE